MHPAALENAVALLLKPSGCAPTIAKSAPDSGGTARPSLGMGFDQVGSEMVGGIEQE